MIARIEDDHFRQYPYHHQLFSHSQPLLLRPVSAVRGFRRRYSLTLRARLSRGRYSGSALLRNSTRSFTVPIDFPFDEPFTVSSWASCFVSLPLVSAGRLISTRAAATCFAATRNFPSPLSTFHPEGTSTANVISCGAAVSLRTQSGITRVVPA